MFSDKSVQSILKIKKKFLCSFFFKFTFIDLDKKMNDQLFAEFNVRMIIERRVVRGRFDDLQMRLHQPVRFLDQSDCQVSAKFEEFKDLS